MLVVILFGYGVIFGSFINALVWRMHGRSIGKKVPSIFHGRSMCPNCKHVLAAKDLVPVVSWLSLHGRCRYCRRPVSAQYPLVELLTGLLFVIFYLGWPFSLSGLHLVWFFYGLLYIIFFVALAVYDYKWFLLPDKLVFSLTALASSQVVVTTLWQRDFQAFIEPLFGGALFFGIFWVIYQLSSGKWIGGGDVKLAFALGLIVGGPLEAMMVLFAASSLGTLVSVPLIVRQKKGLQQHIPFGPYLLAGCFIVMLYSERITNWYTGLFL